MASSSEEGNITVSGLTDFSQFCPAGKMAEGARTQREEGNKPVRYRPKGTTWFSRIGKSNSLTVVDSNSKETSTGKLEGGGGGEKKLKRSQKSHSKSRNSLPDESMIFHKEQDNREDIKTKKRTDEETRNISPIDIPMSHLLSLQKELDALKGCVSKQRAVFSPSNSPDLCCLEEAEEYPKPHPPPLIVDTPFNILSCSSTENVIFPLEEYSVQVEPFYPSSEADSGDAPENPGKRLERQGSLEYDHLENPQDERAESKQEDMSLGSPPTSDSSGYFVAVQFSEEENKDVKTSTLLATNDEIIPSRKNSVISVHDNQKQPPPHPFLTLQHGKPTPINALSTRLYSSIPGRLNSPSLSGLSRFSSPSHTHFSAQPWSSSMQLTTPITDETCHCPSCCTCGSSLRRLNGEKGTAETNPSHTRQASYDFLSGGGGVGYHSCPLKRYNKLRDPVQPVCQVSPLILGRTAVKNEKTEQGRGREELLCNTVSIHSFTSHDGGSHGDTASVLSGGGAGGGDSDTQSLWSTPSMNLNSSGVILPHPPPPPPATCCDRTHVSYNNGVDVNVFKERLDVSKVYTCTCIYMCITCTCIHVHYYTLCSVYRLIFKLKFWLAELL